MRGSTKKEIEEFIAARQHIEKDAKVLVACSHSMLEAKDIAAAREFFSKAVRAAYSGHWSLFMGGQKLRLQELRIALDGDAGRDAGFDILIDELASGQTFGSSLFLNLDQVLEQVATAHPYVEYWEETAAHLREYREYQLATPIASNPQVSTHSDLLAFLLAEAFGTNCPEILDHARAAVVSIATEMNGRAILEALSGFLRRQPNGSREAAALMLKLRSVSHLRKNIVNEARQCLDHPDYVVFSLGSLVLKELGEPVDPQPLAKLPAFYQIQPSGTPQAQDSEPPSGLRPGSRPLWTDDPWSQTSTLKVPLERLAEATSIDIETLRRRCAQFMVNEGGREAFGPDAEDALQRRLGRLHLKYPWRRLMPMGAERAFGMMVKELVLANEVDQKVPPFIRPVAGGPPFKTVAFPIDKAPRLDRIPKISSG